MPANNVHQLAHLRFGEALRLFAMTPRALRFYEERGLIEARRDALNRRYYDASARRRLARIGPLRSAGLSIGDIREVLAADEVGDEGRLCALAKLESRRAVVAGELAALTAAIADFRTAAPPETLPTRKFGELGLAVREAR